MVANPLRDLEAEAWDYALIESIRTPGLAEVVGATSPRGWDEQKGFGTSGAFLRWTGDPLSEFQLKLYFWKAEHFDEWAATIEPLVRKTPKGRKPRALAFRHPATDELDIRTVVVTDRTQLTPEDETGLWSVTITFKAYKAPEPVLTKPDPAKAGPDGNPEPQDEADRMIQGLQKQIEAEASGG